MKLGKLFDKLLGGLLTDIAGLHILKRQAERFCDVIVAVVLVFDVTINAGQAGVVGRLLMRMDDNLGNVGRRRVENGLRQLVLKRPASGTAICGGNEPWQPPVRPRSDVLMESPDKRCDLDVRQIDARRQKLCLVVDVIGLEVKAAVRISAPGLLIPFLNH